MARKRVLWQLYPPYLIIIVLSIVAVAWYAVGSIRSFYFKDTLTRLEVENRLISASLRSDLQAGDRVQLQRDVKAASARFDGRITVVATDGTVLADSHADPARMENHARRPEIAAALTTGEGHSTRFSNTLQRELMYVALRLDIDTRQRFIVRTALPLTMVQQAISGLRNRLLWSALLAAVLAGLVGLFLTRRLVRPLETLRANALQLAAGHLHTRVPLSETEEFAALAEAMNHMARELEERINTISSQRNEQDAILSSMVEGIIAVDNDRRIMRLNRAAATMLSLEAENVQGQSIQAAIRHAELLRLIDATFSQAGTVEGEIQLSNETGTALQCRGGLLRAIDGSRLGVIM
ncbi:MAG: HAMP domain-containing protein, partial [Candidatus Zixiibacteriota bacterium]